MYFSKKRSEDVPEELTAIWSCVNEGCNGWMRANFAFEVEPTCPQCQSPMVSSMKKLPLLVNTNHDQKSPQKNADTEHE